MTVHVIYKTDTGQCPPLAFETRKAAELYIKGWEGWDIKWIDVKTLDDVRAIKEWKKAKG
jgi:hypothetical protein